MLHPQVDQGAASMEALKQEAATANARVEELTAQVEAAREELQAANKARAEAQVGAETATRQATAAQDAAAAATSRADEVTAEAEQLRQAATAADTERAAAVTAQLAAAAAEKEAVARAEAAEQQVRAAVGPRCPFIVRWRLMHGCGRQPSSSSRCRRYKNRWSSKSKWLKQRCVRHRYDSQCTALTVVARRFALGTVSTESTAGTDGRRAAGCPWATDESRGDARPRGLETWCVGGTR